MEAVTRRGRRPLLAAVGLGAVAAIVLAGCSRADLAEAGGGENVPVGASAEVYQEALADMEPVTLVYQTLNVSPDAPNSAPVLRFIERIEEYSGGQITLETTWANGIVPNPVEVDRALADGRIDIGNFWPQYNPSEYPASNLLLEASVLRDPQVVPGFYSLGASLQELGLGTPEVMAEFEDKGITPLAVMQPDGPTLLACSQPFTTLEDLAGKQIRAGGTSHARQLEELGAIPVSLPYTEVYEALQRGILDCTLMTPVALTATGILEVAPWLHHTTTESFTSVATNLYAGPKFKTLPLAAQQLIMESAEVMRGDTIATAINEFATDTATMAAANGGGFIAFDVAVDERLAEINAGTWEEIAASTVLDGPDFIERANAANDKWNGIVLELGYVDEGSIVDVPEWFTGTDPTSWTDAVFEEIVAERVGD